MKAARIIEWGQPYQIIDIPKPEIGADEVLVKIHSSSINGIDVAVAMGMLQSMLQAPMTAGTDFAGEVVAVSEGVTHVKPGDAVFGFIPVRGGTFADYLIAKSSEVALKPRSISFAEAGVVPLAALPHGRLYSILLNCGKANEFLFMAPEVPLVDSPHSLRKILAPTLSLLTLQRRWLT
jgi:alcohol dehydrogenase